MMPRLPVVIALRFMLLGLLALVSSPSTAEWYSDQQAIMGTEVVARLWHDDPEQGRAALAAVMNELHRIDRHFSPYKPDSELSRLNREAPKASAETPLPITAELAELLHQSIQYGELTDGAFDVTFGSVGRLYDYRSGHQPDDATRKALLAAIDYRRIHLDRKANTVWFDHPKLYVDLGGIAKGYGVDRAIELLRARGVKHASVSAGGDTRLIGDHRGRPWRVGIKNPRAPEDVAIVVPLSDEAISTSGDYERYFVDAQGQRIHHILNPRTGTSARGIISATVLGPRAMDTDALSTSVFVLGLEAGLALINRQPEFEAIVITDDGRVHYSDGLVDPED
ncbi:FAD:protein FMN transferase [Marinimicrobium sp. C6131]|uniref:FAD:protein FMN transferase n=1 Tax=Marinimicrobium sp. C6131 TaxID=3022676 RepID=UPI00223CA233|nr:FAD:protein FMN transferase [Marinimicrobium sp. C6131]UZJ43498.1 FAD:protein FMN transferase [Marinimicrobium sp. C6131]